MSTMQIWRGENRFTQQNIFNGIDLSFIKNVSSVALNGIFEIVGIPGETTRLFNAPLRIWNCLHASENGEYWKIGLDALAFTSLLYPEGRPVAIFIDLTAEALDLYWKPSGNASKEPVEEESFEPITWARACEILNLKEDEAKDPSIAKKHYEDVCRDLDIRIGKLEISPPLQEELKKMRRKRDKAFKVLTQQEMPA